MELDRGTHPLPAVAPPDQRLTDRLRRAAADAWDELPRHPFIKRMAADTLDEQTFHHFLVQEHAMLDAFVQLVGHAVATGGDLAEQRALASLLHGLTGERDQYLHRQLESAHGVASPDDLAPLHTPSAELRQLMLGVVAREGREEALALILARVWPAAAWASAHAQARPRAAYAQWIMMAANGADVEMVEGLRAGLDLRGPELTSDRQQRLADLFRWGVDLQVHIWDAALVAREPPVPPSSEPEPSPAPIP